MNVYLLKGHLWPIADNTWLMEDALDLHWPITGIIKFFFFFKMNTNII